MKTNVLVTLALVAGMILADMPETAETDESGQSAGEAAGTLSVMGFMNVFIGT